MTKDFFENDREKKILFRGEVASELRVQKVSLLQQSYYFGKLPITCEHQTDQRKGYKMGKCM